MSASSTTTLGNSSASADSALPKASRSEAPLDAIKAGALDIQQFLHLRARRAQRLQRFFRLLARQLHAAVPGRNVLHVFDALALDGMGDDHRRPPLRHTGAAEGRKDLRNVVPVDLGDGP